MSLSDILIPTEDVSVGKTSLSVRGLCFSDIALLIHKHRDALDKAVSVFGKDGGEAQLVQVLLTELPELAAQIIACACDEPESVLQARRVPGPAQLNALIAIGRLTFDEAGGVKKFAEQIADLFKSARLLIPGQVS